MHGVRKHKIKQKKQGEMEREVASKIKRAGRRLERRITKRMLSDT